MVGLPCCDTALENDRIVCTIDFSAASLPTMSVCFKAHVIKMTLAIRSYAWPAFEETSGRSRSCCLVIEEEWHQISKEPERRSASVTS